MWGLWGSSGLPRCFRRSGLLLSRSRDLNLHPPNQSPEEDSVVAWVWKVTHKEDAAVTAQPEIFLISASWGKAGIQAGPESLPQGSVSCQLTSVGSTVGFSPWASCCTAVLWRNLGVEVEPRSWGLSISLGMGSWGTSHLYP